MSSGWRAASFSSRKITPNNPVLVFHGSPTWECHQDSCHQDHAHQLGTKPVHQDFSPSLDIGIAVGALLQISGGHGLWYPSIEQNSVRDVLFPKSVCLSHPVMVVIRSRTCFKGPSGDAQRHRLFKTGLATEIPCVTFALTYFIPLGLFSCLVRRHHIQVMKAWFAKVLI